MSGAAQAADVLDAAAARKRARLLHSAREVDRAIARMAKEITAALAAANPVVLAVLHGGVFTASRAHLALRTSLTSSTTCT